MKWKMLFIACLVASTIGVGAYRGSFLSTKSLWEDNLEAGFGLPLSHNGRILPPTAVAEDERALPVHVLPTQPLAQQGTPLPGSVQTGGDLPGALQTRGSQPSAPQTENPFKEAMCECERIDQEAQILAKQINNHPDEKKKAELRNELRNKLADLFDRKLAAQAQEAQELSEKLMRLQKNLAARQGNKAAIVDSRVRDLMGEGWSNGPQAPTQLAQTAKGETRVPFGPRSPNAPGALNPLSSNPGSNSAGRAAEGGRASAAASRGAAAAAQNRAAANAAESFQWNVLADRLATVFSANSRFATDPDVLRIEVEKAKLELVEAEENLNRLQRQSAQGLVSQEELRKTMLNMDKAKLDLELVQHKLKMVMEGLKTPPARQKETAPAKDKPTGATRRMGAAYPANDQEEAAQVVILGQIRNIQKIGPIEDQSPLEEACPFEAAELAKKAAVEKAIAAHLKKTVSEVRKVESTRTCESIETSKSNEVSKSNEGHGSAKANSAIFGMGVRIPNPQRAAPGVPAPTVSGLSTPKPVILFKGTVDEVKGKKIILSNGDQCEANAKTEIIQKTENGEKKGKLSDVKSGASIEVELDKDSKCPKKITVSFIFSVASNNLG